MRSKSRRPRASKHCKNKTIRGYADSMACRMTGPEWAVWKLLRMQNRNRWLPQYPISAFKKWYILDFYLKDAKLAVEIDDPGHDPSYDAERDEALRNCHGVRTLRFTNQQALDDAWGVVCEICQAVPREHR